MEQTIKASISFVLCISLILPFLALSDSADYFYDGAGRLAGVPCETQTYQEGGGKKFPA